MHATSGQSGKELEFQSEVNNICWKSGVDCFLVNPKTASYPNAPLDKPSPPLLYWATAPFVKFVIFPGAVLRSGLCHLLFSSNTPIRLEL